LHRSCNGPVHIIVRSEFKQFDNATTVDNFPKLKPVSEPEHRPAEPEFNHSKPGSAEPDHAVEHFAIEHNDAVEHYNSVKLGHVNAAAFRHKSVQYRKPI
jgi:hypothetical protein